jgi:hypothetical protein
MSRFTGSTYKPTAEGRMHGAGKTDRLAYTPTKWKKFDASIKKTYKTHTLIVNGWKCTSLEDALARIRSASLPCTLVWVKR